MLLGMSSSSSNATTSAWNSFVFRRKTEDQQRCLKPALQWMKQEQFLRPPVCRPPKSQALESFNAPAKHRWSYLHHRDEDPALFSMMASPIRWSMKNRTMGNKAPIGLLLERGLRTSSPPACIPATTTPATNKLKKQSHPSREDLGDRAATEEPIRLGKHPCWCELRQHKIAQPPLKATMGANLTLGYLRLL
jgi:hypothetical protein